MARPKKPSGQKRGRHVGVRFDETEYEKIISEAKSIGLNLSEYVRAKATKGYARVPKYADIDTALINRLSKLAGLLKQFFTATDGLHKEKTAAILDDIQALIRLIARRVEDDWQARFAPEET
jgi:hypothetical protein